MKHWALRTISEILSQEWKVLIWRGKKYLSNFEVLGKLQQLLMHHSFASFQALFLQLFDYSKCSLLTFPEAPGMLWLWFRACVVEILRCDAAIFPMSNTIYNSSITLANAPKMSSQHHLLLPRAVFLSSSLSLLLSAVAPLVSSFTVSPTL